MRFLGSHLIMRENEDLNLNNWLRLKLSRGG
jgi:hypothetical protein